MTLVQILILSLIGIFLPMTVSAIVSLCIKSHNSRETRQDEIENVFYCKLENNDILIGDVMENFILVNAVAEDNKTEETDNEK